MATKDKERMATCCSSNKRLQKLIRRAAAAPNPEPSWLGWVLGFTEPAAEVAYEASHDQARLAGCALVALIISLTIAFREVQIVAGTNAYPVNNAGELIRGIHLTMCLLCSSCAVCYWRRIEMEPQILRRISITTHYLLTVANLVRIFRIDQDSALAFHAGYWLGNWIGAVPIIGSIILEIPAKHIVASVTAQSLFALMLGFDVGFCTVVQN